MREKIIRDKAYITSKEFDKLAHRYDKLYNAYLKHTHRRMLNKLVLKPEDEILDISAGTGLIADAAIQKFGPFKRFVVNDPSSRMLEIAKYRLRYNLLNVEFTNHYAEDLPFEDDSFDHIICLNSFHYYVDQPTALAHIRRILKPGGIFWTLNWNRVGLFKIANWVIRAYATEHINTLTLDEMKTLLDENNFTIQEEETWSYRWWNFFFLRCG